MQAVRALIFASLAVAATSAKALIVTSAFDGGWYDPEHPGQGFTFEQVTGANGRKELLVYFSTFDVDGTPTLLVAQAPVTGNVANLSLNRPVVTGTAGGGTFPTPLLIPAGSLTLNMTSCNRGRADFVVTPRPGAGAPVSLAKIRVGTGSLNIQRLYSSTGQAKRCVGGISDDTVPTDSPGMFEKFYDGPFVNARAFYEKRPDRSELDFDLRGLPIGNYQLLVDGVLVTQFESQPFRGNTRAAVRFTSPLTDGARLLDFDPLDRTITLVKAGDSTITDQFRTPQGTTVLDTQPIEVGVEIGNSRQIAQDFGASQVVGSGVRSDEDFLLEAVLRETATSSELTLSLENAAEGNYDVLVDGKRRGTVYVKPRFSGITFGQVRFRKPVEAGAFPLDFIPNNAEVKFLRNGDLDYQAIILTN